MRGALAQDLKGAAATFVLVAAGLCVRRFVRLASLDPGDDPGNALTFNAEGMKTVCPARVEETKPSNT